MLDTLCYFALYSFTLYSVSMSLKISLFMSYFSSITGKYANLLNKVNVNNCVQNVALANG